MFTGMEIMACPNLAVSAEIMRHVVSVESGANRYAIGVVGGHLVRQPQNLSEALATVNMLETGGYNYSLGVAQINRANLGKFGLDTYEKAFEVCPNVAAGARILAACHARSGGDWGKSFSCYYSGNAVTGFRDGYVQKIYGSINRNATPPSTAEVLRAIPLQPTGMGTTRMVAHGPENTTSATAAYRVAIRSVALEAALAATVHAVSSDFGAATVQPAPYRAATTMAPAAPQATGVDRATLSPATNPMDSDATTNEIFVPEVRGPDHPVANAQPQKGVPQMQATDALTISATSSDRADVRQERRDAAFVF